MAQTTLTSARSLSQGQRPNEVKIHKHAKVTAYFIVSPKYEKSTMYSWQKTQLVPQMIRFPELKSLSYLVSEMWPGQDL